MIFYRRACKKASRLCTRRRFKRMDPLFLAAPSLSGTANRGRSGVFAPDHLVKTPLTPLVSSTSTDKETGSFANHFLVLVDWVSRDPMTSPAYHPQYSYPEATSVGRFAKLFQAPHTLRNFHTQRQCTKTHGLIHYSNLQSALYVHGKPLTSSTDWYHILPTEVAFGASNNYPQFHPFPDGQNPSAGVNSVRE